MLEIEFANQQNLPVDTGQLAALAKAILHDHDCRRGELSIALVDDGTIQGYNERYLGHDWATDVISFVLEQDTDSLTGQLIVSTETAQRVAQEVGTSTSSEVALYVAHGTLHLVGYDDQSEVDATKMRDQEAKYLERFSIEFSSREV